MATALSRSSRRSSALVSQKSQAAHPTSSEGIFARPLERRTATVPSARKPAACSAWTAWRFTESFGCPTFLDFGRNYAAARDEFVYMYSPDANSAYQAADQLVLARVPKTRIGDRDSYEFFVGLDDRGQPLWSHDLGQRRSVFGVGQAFYRSRVTYNGALRRYLLVQPVPDTASRDRTGRLDTRSHGGLAIYDAPEPWGPWTTAYFADRWDVGPGDSASFPSKWMSADGTTLHLVFSGDDCFSVREATLVLPRKGSTSVTRPPACHTTATLTQWIGGSASNRRSHRSPPSRPIQSWPVVVPK